MKLIYTFLFSLILSCGGTKTTTETTKTVEKPVTPTVIETPKEAPKPIIEDEKLLVVLKNPNSLANVKEYITNSGLTWDTTAFENDATKIGIVKVPGDKTDFWLDSLKNSNQFESVSPHSKTTLNSLIKKANASFFTFRKTVCFGDCPVYDVSIDAKGNVTYKGLQYVNVTGERKFALTEKQFATLKQKLANNNFSDYKKIYDNPNITDLPSTYISYKDKKVQIRLWKNIPRNLTDLHEYVQGILLDKKFFD